VLVRLDEGEGALAIGQLAHAWLSGQIARVWGNARFPAPDPCEEISLGAEQHDIGWARVDLEPRLNVETGLPRNFLELSAEEHLAIWRHAPDLLASQSLHASLVVSLHGRSLSELRLQARPERPGPLERHISDERARQTRLCEILGVSDSALERTRRQMWTWDGLSLALCNRWRPFAARDVPSRDGRVDVELRDRADGTLTLDPWPLAGERIELRCEGRRLDARYADESEMRRAFEHAALVPLRFVLVAP
jgi:Protein of unknown function (DUF3891)